VHDRDGLAAACTEWVNRHGTTVLDDAAGRSEAARVLELWPGDHGENWETDPRAELIRFFLDGREASVSAATLLRATESLSEVPDYVSARVKLRAGDVSAAREISAHPADPGSPDWTLFCADLARALIRQDRARDARGVLDLVPVASREDCEGLLARRDVARALKDAAELAIVNQRLDALKSGPRSADVSTGGGTIPLCLDAEQAGAAYAMRLSSAAPALVEYGWGRGRTGTVLFQGDRVLTISAAGLSGRRNLAVRTIAGGPVRVLVTATTTTVR
jgi:hypothetical protein